MPYWEPLTIDGQTYDLAHLEPFEFQITPTQSDVPATISVRFHDHCFTETFDPRKHTARIRTSQASLHEYRAFCLERYQLSFQLPQIIVGLDGKKVASTREGNLVRITLADGNTYPMFFTLRKARERRVEMFVVSAYIWERENPPADTGEMKFNLAVAKVLKGEKPKFPRR
ncbi:MAG: hypothetical protein ABS40_04140 [Agrobacterium sp. SCN 61-19]|nr:MAG: hypothetical protein ABS40_04140 [Agrobacterium sp. SCN 61-19]